MVNVFGIFLKQYGKLILAVTHNFVKVNLLSSGVVLYCTYTSRNFLSVTIWMALLQISRSRYYTFRFDSESHACFPSLVDISNHTDRNVFIRRF